MSGAYIQFVNFKCKDLVDTEKIPHKEAFAKCGSLWKELNDEQKQPFVEKEKADRVRYEKEMKEFNETGFFTNKEGVNSKDLDKVKVKPKKGEILKKKSKEDKILKPKKACVPFMFLVKEKSKALIEEHKFNNAS